METFDPEFEEHVREAAAFGVAFEFARAIWLVDVCGSRYSVAAAEIGLRESEFAKLLSRARRAVRSLVEQGEPVTSGHGRDIPCRGPLSPR